MCRKVHIRIGNQQRQDVTSGIPPGLTALDGILQMEASVLNLPQVLGYSDGKEETSTLVSKTWN